ncbi:MAG: beta-lactamase family protein [Raineya sp.]|jgi:CubicO group peptidase (beta-lactamase class C family)|nr:beta-lactamase family protein [Raineya sp.]
MKQFFKFYLYILITFFTVFSTYGQQKDDYSYRIDSLLQTTNPRPFNGVVLITQKGKTKYLKTFGYSNFETKTPITINDRFRIQSMSKQITAVIILKEVEKGKINLHVPIRKYLPDFKQTWADTVTIHHLLNNTAGITNITQPLSFKPGTAYYYSNPGYGLLRPIIEKVTGKTFIEVANSLFKELKMSNSYCYEMDKPNVGLVNGYRVSNDSVELYNFKSLKHTVESWSDFIPAGGMISNAQDLNLWDTKLHKGKILKPETYKLMTTYEITAQHESFGKEQVGYGYGLRISDKSAVIYLGHSGKGIGFMSLKFYIPSKDVDVIILQNFYDADSKLHYHFESKIREIILNSRLVK